MEKIIVEITWEDKNYCCGWGLEGFGAIICTAKNLQDLKVNFEESLRNQIFDMKTAGEELPGWLSSGDYVVEYDLAVSAMLRQAEEVTTMAVISRFTGINQKQLSHYANSVKIPRQAQRQRIVSGLHAIGERLQQLGTSI